MRIPPSRIAAVQKPPRSPSPQGQRRTVVVTQGNGRQEPRPADSAHTSGRGRRQPLVRGNGWQHTKVEQGRPSSPVRVGSYRGQQTPTRGNGWQHAQNTEVEQHSATRGGGWQHSGGARRKPSAQAQGGDPREHAIQQPGEESSTVATGEALPMLAIYRGENTRAINPALYLNESERARYRTDIVDGKLQRGGAEVNTSSNNVPMLNRANMPMPGGVRDQSFSMIVMDSNDNIFQGLYHKQSFPDGRVAFHSSYVAGDSAIFSGYIQAENGLAKKVIMQSGHYRPGVSSLYFFIKKLEEKGLDITGLTLTAYAGHPWNEDINREGHTLVDLYHHNIMLVGDAAELYQKIYTENPVLADQFVNIIKENGDEYPKDPHLGYRVYPLFKDINRDQLFSLYDNIEKFKRSEITAQEFVNNYNETVGDVPPPPYSEFF